MSVIDLTLPLRDCMKMLPVMPRVSITDHLNFSFTAPLYEPPCQGVTIKMISMPDHAGTHIDAPLHFIPGGKDISQIPPDRFIGEAVLIDASTKGIHVPLTASMLQNYIKEQNIEIFAGDIVIIRLWPKQWGEEGYFNFKSLDGSAADFLIEQGIKAVGVDAYSVDCLENKQRPVHMKLLEKEIFPVESLVNLEKIKQKRFKFIALPLALETASGSPARAIAIVD